MPLRQLNQSQISQLTQQHQDPDTSVPSTSEVVSSSTASPEKSTAKKNPFGLYARPEEEPRVVSGAAEDDKIQLNLAHP